MDPAELSGGSLFGALSGDATRFLLDNGVLWQAGTSDTVFEYGDRGDSFFIVCLGALDFYKEREGQRFLTRTVEFGGEVGFVAMIALHDHVGRAVATEPTLLLEVNSHLFSQLHEAFPLDFGLMTLNLARDMARVIRKLGDTLVENSIPH